MTDVSAQLPRWAKLLLEWADDGESDALRPKRTKSTEGETDA
jgi:hypothetical protein